VFAGSSRSSSVKHPALDCRPLILPGGFFLAWELVSHLELVPTVFLPLPEDVLRALVKSATDGTLLVNVSASCFRIFTGFVIAFVLAVPLGAAMGSSFKVRQYFESLNDFVRYIPVPAMVPLLILWLGVSDECQIAVIVFGTLPQILIMVVDSVTRTPSEYLAICDTLHLTALQRLSYVYVPYASPQIYDAARVSIGWAWSYLVVAEIIGADKGVGQSIIVAQRFLRTDQVLAGILVVAMLGLATDFSLRAFYPMLFPWTERVRHRKV
jgi:NitT/TauT family transport system permease protein